jgi:hypothetical protein
MAKTLKRKTKVPIKSKKVLKGKKAIHVVTRTKILKRKTIAPIKPKKVVKKRSKYPKQFRIFNVLITCALLALSYFFYRRGRYWLGMTFLIICLAHNVYPDTIFYGAKNVLTLAFIGVHFLQRVVTSVARLAGINVKIFKN